MYALYKFRYSLRRQAMIPLGQQSERPRIFARDVRLMLSGAELAALAPSENFVAVQDPTTGDRYFVPGIDAPGSKPLHPGS